MLSICCIETSEYSVQAIPPLQMEACNARYNPFGYSHYRDLETMMFQSKT
jgi:hypothetical protein